MALPSGLEKYQGKRRNSSSDRSDRRIYTRYFKMAPGKGLDDIQGLARGDLMPQESDKYVLKVGIVNDKDSRAEIVEIVGYKNKEWA